MNLSTRLFALIVMTLLPVVGVEIYDEIDARTLRAEEGKDLALRLARLVAQEQSKILEGANQLLMAVGRTPSIREHDLRSCNAYLADLIGGYKQYVSFVSTDTTGHPVCASSQFDPNAALADHAYVKLAHENLDFTVGEYETDILSQRKVLHLSLPYRDESGQIAGVVAAALSLDWLNGELARSPLPNKATVSVIDRQGNIVGRYPDSAKFVGTRISGGSHAHLLHGGEGVQEAPGFDHIPRIFAFTTLQKGPSNLVVSVGLDKAELSNGYEASNLRDIVVIGGSCLVALIMAGIGARSFIGQPLLALLKTAEHWRKGNLDARVPFPDTHSEFGRLGAAFNSMAVAVAAREQDLERRVQERTEALTQAMQARQAAESALHEARKMETVGRLTGGMAHDFNNLLAAVVGNIELARSHLGPHHPQQPRLAAALQSANRGAALVQQLLTFARRQTLHPRVIDLNHWIQRARVTLQRMVRADVTIEVSLSVDTWFVRVDPNQLEAAILNLVMNARDAMPIGGMLRLETRNANFPSYAAPIGLVGDFVSLTVRDSGVGIKPDVLDKVFEPFFTTKEIGAGSGLGLSMVQGFVRQSSGSVAIKSTPGVGTAVTLYLPRSTEIAMPTPIGVPDDRPARMTAENPRARQPVGAAETVQAQGAGPFDRAPPPPGPADSCPTLT